MTRIFHQINMKKQKTLFEYGANNIHIEEDQYDYVDKDDEQE